MKQIFGFILLLLTFPLYAKPTEIVMWYSLAGHVGMQIRQLIADFNHQQKDYMIKPVYKGEYTETLTSFAAAFRAEKPPAIIQIFEVGTTIMLFPSGIIEPVEDLMIKHKLNLAKENLLPAIRNGYSKNNRLMAMPFNTSIPVLYYNADVLKQLGYTENNFPKTWQELEILAEKLKEHGFPCAYTTAYPSWIQIESFAAIHGLPMIDAQGSKALYNNKELIHHLKRLKRWQEKGYFEYGGRTSDATVLFSSERCALFSQSSGAYNSLAQLVKFKLGVANLPLDNTVSLKRYNNVAGGAALWAVSGQSTQIYDGIAAFFTYLAQPQVQKKWHQKTGYLPLGLTGVYASLANSSNHPILKLAKIDLSYSQNGNTGLYLGPQNLIRTINDEALEAIFSGMKTPQKAMDEAVTKANYTLLRFARNNVRNDNIT